jgi:hypothetical protein
MLDVVVPPELIEQLLQVLDGLRRRLVGQPLLECLGRLGRAARYQC